MSDEELVLVDLALGKGSADQKHNAWSCVLDLCLECGVDRFVIEPDSRAPSGLESAYARLGEIGVEKAGRRHLGSEPESIELARALGPGVVALNLYAGNAWYGGIFDWGHSVAVLLDAHNWATLKSALADSGWLTDYDVADAEGRPTLQQ